MPELVHLRRLTRNNTLHKLHSATHSSPSRNRILRRLRVHLDQTNPWVLWSTIVLAVAEVAEPGFQSWAVVLADALAVGLDRSGARDGGPFAGGREEAEVDVRVGVEVVSLAGFGVCVEDEVDSVIFLYDTRIVGQLSCLISSRHIDF